MSGFRVPILYAILIIGGFALQVAYPRLTEMLAILPRDFNHLPGVITTVFMHGDIEHLCSNILPLSVCLAGLFYFYKEIALKVTIFCHLITGILIWIFARPAYHIGASGLAYALVFFILASALIRKNRRLMILAFIVLVFQNGLIWGVFPQENRISWESHLMGSIVGAFLAFLFRKEGPLPEKPFEWDEEPDEEKDEYEDVVN